MFLSYLTQSWLWGAIEVSRGARASLAAVIHFLGRGRRVVCGVLRSRGETQSRTGFVFLIFIFESYPHYIL